ncbi:HERV-H LTR-associating protein 2 isoform 2-T2 [Leptodactylus fuscus]|uniref:HERV-H LTR-associating protein 2 isoform X2 n=1 Tax=Leptodactylus fuscus TaxID=238119 RepID=UPI003F4F328F
MSAMFFLLLIFCNVEVFHAGKDEVIHWTIGNINVHSYYMTTDHLEDQDKQYSGRTSLFVNEISKGNASLLIRGLQKSDENAYKCYVGTKSESTEQIIALQVIGALLGEQNRDIILPCSFKPGKEEVIHWTIGSNIHVHSYYKGKDHLEGQDEAYTGRTSLFVNEISKGNASLLIRKLNKTDENTYKCYVGTQTESTEHDIYLQVIDLQQTMDYTFDDNGMHLTCSVNASSSQGITIKWYQNGQEVYKSQSTESSYIVKNDSLEYSCTIYHASLQSIWTGTWRMKEPIMKDDNVTCNFCDDPVYARWDLIKQGTNKMTIALRSKSLTTINTDYENRINTHETCNLSLAQLGESDIGSYICLIQTEQKMDIEKTFVNITVEKATHRNRLMLLIILLDVLFICGILCSTWKSKKESQPISTMELQSLRQTTSTTEPAESSQTISAPRDYVAASVENF